MSRSSYWPSEPGRGGIHRRIGLEINERTLGRALADLVHEGAVTAAGDKRWRRYRLAAAEGQEQ